MFDFKKYSPSQRVVLKAAPSTILLVVATFAIASVLPLPKPHAPLLADRLTFSLRWIIFEVVFFMIGVFIIGSIRFLTAQINPLVKKDIERIEIYNRCLQNTLEQLVISVLGKLIMASYMDEDGLRFIPVFVFLFVVARTAFWIGYSIDPMARAFGMSMTFDLNVTILVYCVFCVLSYGPSYGLNS